MPGLTPRWHLECHGGLGGVGRYRVFWMALFRLIDPAFTFLRHEGRCRGIGARLTGALPPDMGAGSKLVISTDRW